MRAIEKTFPIPWFVYTGELRARFPIKIVEIVANDNKVVLPWGAFDGMSPAQAESLANYIVKAVNKKE